MILKLNLKSNKDFSQINYRVSPKSHLPKFSFKKWLRHHVWLQIFSIILTLILMFLLAMYFVTPLNKIQKVSVKGNNTIAKDEIVKDLRAAPGDSLSRFYFHRYHYKNQIMNNDVQLRDIRISFYKWNHINIYLNEYPTLAYFKNNDKYYAVIPSGKIAGQVDNLKSNCPVLINFSRVHNFKSFINEYRKIPNEIKADINHVVFSPTSIDPDRVLVYMNDGNRVYANFETWGMKMKYYSVISKLMNRKGTINLEVGAYSYYK